MNPKPPSLSGPASATDAPGRRRLLYAGVATAAAAAGAALAWLKLEPQEVAEGAEAALWRMGFDTPDGGRLTMEG